MILKKIAVVFSNVFPRQVRKASMIIWYNDVMVQDVLVGIDVETSTNQIGDIDFPQAWLGLEFVDSVVVRQGLPFAVDIIRFPMICCCDMACLLQHVKSENRITYVRLNTWHTWYVYHQDPMHHNVASNPFGAGAGFVSIIWFCRGCHAHNFGGHKIQ